MAEALPGRLGPLYLDRSGDRRPQLSHSFALETLMPLVAHK